MAVSVTGDTLKLVTECPVRWLVLVVRVPADPSRHRVAVWRELRRAGAVLLGQGVWAVPDAPVFADGIARTIALAERGEGEVTVLTATGRDEPAAARLEALLPPQALPRCSSRASPDCSPPRSASASVLA
jgi:hypothetical protein